MQHVNKNLAERSIVIYISSSRALVIYHRKQIYDYGKREGKKKRDEIFIGG